MSIIQQDRERETEHSDRSRLNRRIVLIVLVVLVLTAAIAAFYIFQGKQGVPAGGQGVIVPTYSTEEQAVLALKNWDAHYCDVFSDEGRRNVCLSDYYLARALKEKMGETCESVPLEPVSEACSAVIEGNLDSCDMINGSWKGICVNFINNGVLAAFENSDQAFCDGMEGVEDFSISYCRLIIGAVSS